MILVKYQFYTVLFAFLCSVQVCHSQEGMLLFILKQFTFELFLACL